MVENEKKILSVKVMDYSSMRKAEPGPGLGGAVPIVLCKTRSVLDNLSAGPNWEQLVQLALGRLWAEQIIIYIIKKSICTVVC
jgi:hypothetical protein